MLKITQRKHDENKGGKVFYETAIEDEVYGSWYPIEITDDKILKKISNKLTPYKD